MTTMLNVPHALSTRSRIEEEIEGKAVAVFLDYDGTLTPIVQDPEKAIMSTQMREVVASLAEQLDTSIVTGRSRAKIVNFVQLESLFYAASHGFDILGPKGQSSKLTQVATSYLPTLATVRDAIDAQLVGIEGAFVEDNIFSVSVHYRKCPNHEEVIPRIKAIVDEELARCNQSDRQLRVSHGKCVFELSPNMEWNKGKAVDFLLEMLGHSDMSCCVPVYIGDDTSDERAFESLGKRGVSVLVSEDPKETSARYRVNNPGEVGELLEYLTELAKRGRVTRGHKSAAGVHPRDIVGSIEEQDLEAPTELQR